MTNILNTQSRPSFFAYLATGLTNVTGNATTYTIIFDTVRPGSMSGYNPMTGIFTAPYAGKIFVATCMGLNNIVSGANGNLCGIKVGASFYRISEYAMTGAKSSSNRFITNGGSTFFVNAATEISSVAQLNNGSSAVAGLTGGDGSSGTPYITWLYIKYLP